MLSIKRILGNCKEILDYNLQKFKFHSIEHRIRQPNIIRN